MTSKATQSADLRRLETHFAFGENWQSFVRTVDEERIALAVQSLERLLPDGAARGKTMLDIGCGSGLSMLAAGRLGAARVDGVDIDPASAAAARALLSQHLSNDRWSVREGSVFDLSPEEQTYDIVHSWGVLHHTGDMWPAIDKAARLVAPGGTLVLALYRKTPLCGFWKREKRLYAACGPFMQRALRGLYRGVFFAGLLATGRNPSRYIRDYRNARGMDFSHDVHDWLGGHPYESVAPAEISGFLSQRGFRLIRTFEKPAPIVGLLGSHCDEFVAIRESSR